MLSFPMVLEKLSQWIETARAHATALQRQAGALEPAATAALDQAVEELRAALDELQVAEEQARDQQDALLEARATIEAERERYRQLFRSASNAHLVTDPAGIVREANDAAGDLLGVPVRFLIDKPLAAFVDRTALATFFGAVKVLRETDKSVRELQVTLRLRNEPIGPVTLTVAAVRSPSGDLEGLRWLVHEPGTGRQLALLAAAETAKLRRLLEALPDGVLVHELDGRIVLANAQVSELFGYSQEELIGQPAEALLPERFRARHEEHRAAYAEPPRTRPMGLGLPPVGRRKDGSEFPVDVSLGVVQVDGRVQLVSTIRDVTDQRSPEETRARLAAIVETATDAVIGKTVDGIVTSWNPAAERLFGYAAAEMIGRPFARLAPPEVHGEYQQAQMLVRRGIRVPPFDTVRFHKDGRRLDVNVCLSPILDRAGPSSESRSWLGTSPSVGRSSTTATSTRHRTTAGCAAPAGRYPGTRSSSSDKGGSTWQPSGGSSRGLSSSMDSSATSPTTRSSRPATSSSGPEASIWSRSCGAVPIAPRRGVVAARCRLTHRRDG
jgi:PAS domain S-box-containing protein